MRSSALAVASLTVALSWPLAAQEVRGTVRDSTTRQPIAGAVLTLLDAAGATLGRNITDQRGQYRIALSDGMRRIRVVRIGFRPRDVMIPQPVGGVAQLDVSMLQIATLLEPVRVRDDSRCSRRNDRAAALGLWEQARAGLLAAVVARERAPAWMVRLGFDRIMDLSGDRIVSQNVVIDTADHQPKPFAAAHSAAAFVRVGFAERVGEEWMFYAPDADVLLDEAFAQSYCFHIMDRDRSRPTQIGLGFVPAARQRNRIDVDGALWIDTVTRALGDIEFRYTGLDRAIDRFRPGGRVAFRAMDNGLVIIDRWSLRLVGTRLDTIGRTRIGVTTRATTRTRFDVTEAGGEVARARWQDGTEWKASLGELRVHATTHAGAPAAGTVVRLTGTSYQAVADARGDFTIPDLLPGPYVAVIDDPSLVPIRLALQTTLQIVAVRDSVMRVTLDVPTAEDYVMGECAADKQRTDGPALLVARVMTADGAPVAGIHWLLRRLGALSREEVEIPTPETEILRRGGVTGTNGLLHFCGDRNTLPPLGSTVQIRVWREGGVPLVVKRVLRERVTVVPIVWKD